MLQGQEKSYSVVDTNPPFSSFFTSLPGEGGVGSSFLLGPQALLEHNVAGDQKGRGETPGFS